MKSPESALRAVMIGTDAVARLIGDRVAPDIAPPEWKLPFCVYNVTEREDIRSLDHSLNIGHCTVTMELYDSSHDGVTAIGDAVKNALNFYSGTAAGVTVTSCIIEQDKHDADLIGDGNDERIHRESQVYSVWYKTT